MELSLCDEQDVREPEATSTLENDACDSIGGCTVVNHASIPGDSRSSRYILYLPGSRQRVCASGLDEYNANERGGNFLSSLEHHHRQQELVWLDVCDPTASELDTLAALYKFHHTTREDVRSAEILEKVKFFRHSYVVRILTANVDPSLANFLKPTQLHVIISLNSVLTISCDSNAHARNVWSQICTRSTTTSSSPDDICCALIDDVVKSFSTVANLYKDRSDSIEEQNCAARVEDNVMILQQIGQAREQILKLSRLLAGKPEIITNMMKRVSYHPSFHSQHETKLHLGDVQDHIITLISNVSHVAELLHRTHASHVARLSVQKYIRAASTSDAILRIAVFSVILAPSFLLISLLSLRCHTPGEGVGGYAWFSGIIGGILCYTFLASLLARWLKFL